MRLYLLTLFFLGVSGVSTSARGLRRLATKPLQQSNYEIIGSKAADITKYPYTVSVTYALQDYLLGAGAIVSRNWILCSAFEIEDFPYNHLIVRAGSSKPDSGGQLLNVSKVIVHNKFRIHYPYDVLLIKTATKILFNKHAKPIKLAKSTPRPGTEAHITGFGLINDNATSGSLQVATVRVKSKYECMQQHGDLGRTCICADADGIGPCWTDIGDPLVHHEHLIGYYLGGDVCNRLNKLEVYSNITPLRKWVLESIKRNSNENEMEFIEDGEYYEANVSGMSR